MAWNTAVQNEWHCNALRQGPQGQEQTSPSIACSTMHALTRLHASDTLLSLVSFSYRF